MLCTATSSIPALTSREPFEEDISKFRGKTFFGKKNDGPGSSLKKNSSLEPRILNNPSEEHGVKSDGGAPLQVSRPAREITPLSTCCQGE
jgi:hypothetical protein